MQHLASNWVRNLLIAIIAAVVTWFCSFAGDRIDKTYTAVVRLEQVAAQYQSEHDSIRAQIDAKADTARIEALLSEKASHQEVDLKIRAAIH